MAANIETKIEEVSPVECRVHVEVPWEEVEPKVRRRLSELRRTVRLRGFRRGKVPPKMIERLFRSDVEREVASELVEETFPEASRKSGRRAIGDPVVEKVDHERGKPWVYTARFEVPPVVEPSDYKGVPVRKRPVEVAPSQVEERIEAMRQELAELEPIAESEMDGPTQDGDVWTVDVEGTVGDTPVSLTDAKVELGRKDAQGFEKHLAGALAGLSRKDVGTSRELEFDLPEEDAHLHPSLRGKRAKVTVGLREVKRRVIPALDDEFARDTGKAESLAELRAKVEAEIREAMEAEAEREARMRLVQEILSRNDFEVGPRLVGQEIAARIDAFKRQLASQGLRPEAVGLSDQKLWENFAPEATFNVKAFLLLDAIAKAEGIEVTDEEFDKAVEELAQERGTTAGRLAAQMERSGEAVLLRAQLREEKVLDLLMEHADVTVAPDPSPEEEVAKAAAAAAEDIADVARTGGRRRRRSGRESKDLQGGSDAGSREGEGPAGEAAPEASASSPEGAASDADPAQG